MGLGQDKRNEAGHCREARTEAKGNRSYGLLHPSHLHSHQTMDSRVIGAQHQLHHQCLQCLRGWEDPGIHVMVDISAGNQEATQRSTCQCLRMRTPRMPLCIRLALALDSVSSHWVSRLHPPPLCYPFITNLPGEASEKFGLGHYPAQCPHYIG